MNDLGITDLVALGAQGTAAAMAVITFFLISKMPL